MTKKTIIPEAIFYNFIIALITLALSWFLGGPWMDFETKTTLVIASSLFAAFFIIAIWAKLHNIEKTIKEGRAISGPYQYTRHPIFFAAVFFFNPALAFLLKSWLILIAIIPVFLGREKLSRDVLFTIPFRVIITRYSSLLKSGTLIHEVILSSLSSSRFTSDFPVAYLPASGI